MSGCIVGFYGFQRSGKTLMAYMLAEKYRKLGCNVYTNMICEDFINIDSLECIPFDYKPKVLLLDEVYYFLDSRTWNNKNQTAASIFFNTIGKQNILLLLTAISPDMVEIRLRNQHNYMYLVKSNSKYISYKIIDVQRKKSRVFKLEKTEKLFQGLKYDTKQVPNIIDINLENFSKKINQNEKVKGVRLL